MDQLKIGKFISERRKSQGMTQMQLAEKLTSKEEVVKLIEDIAGMEILFAQFPSDYDFSEKVRFAVNELIKSKM